MGGLNGTTADHQICLAVQVIAGAVTVILQILQQLVFSFCLLVFKSFYDSFQVSLLAERFSVVVKSELVT